MIGIDPGGLVILPNYADIENLLKRRARALVQRPFANLDRDARSRSIRSESSTCARFAFFRDETSEIPDSKSGISNFQFGSILVVETIIRTRLLVRIQFESI